MSLSNIKDSGGYSVYNKIKGNFTELGLLDISKATSPEGVYAQLVGTGGVDVPYLTSAEYDFPTEADDTFTFYVDALKDTSNATNVLEVIIKNNDNVNGVIVALMVNNGYVELRSNTGYSDAEVVAEDRGNTWRLNVTFPTNNVTSPLESLRFNMDTIADTLSTFAPLADGDTNTVKILGFDTIVLPSIPKEVTGILPADIPSVTATYSAEGTNAIGTLPPATGSQVKIYVSVEAGGGTSAIIPTTGESINGAIDAKYSFLAVGEVIMLIDTGVGKWSLQTIGSSTASDLQEYYSGMEAIFSVTATAWAAIEPGVEVTLPEVGTYVLEVNTYTYAYGDNPFIFFRLYDKTESVEIENLKLLYSYDNSTSEINRGKNFSKIYYTTTAPNTVVSLETYYQNATTKYVRQASIRAYKKQTKTVIMAGMAEVEPLHYVSLTGYSPSNGAYLMDIVPVSNIATVTSFIPSSTDTDDKFGMVDTANKKFIIRKAGRYTVSADVTGTWGSDATHIQVSVNGIRVHQLQEGNNGDLDTGDGKNMTMSTVNLGELSVDDEVIVGIYAHSGSHYYGKFNMLLQQVSAGTVTHPEMVQVKPLTSCILSLTTSYYGSSSTDSHATVGHNNGITVDTSNAYNRITLKAGIEYKVMAFVNHGNNNGAAYGVLEAYDYTNGASIVRSTAIGCNINSSLSTALNTSYITPVTDIQVGIKGTMVENVGTYISVEEIPTHSVVPSAPIVLPYSTTAIETGRRWIDGKMIYEVVIPFDAVTSSGVSIGNIGANTKLIRTEIVFYGNDLDASDYQYSGLSNETHKAHVFLINSTGSVMYYKTSYSVYESGYVFVQFTK